MILALPVSIDFRRFTLEIDQSCDALLVMASHVVPTRLSLK